VPRWSGDQCVYLGDYDKEREKAMTEHRVYSIYRIIKDVERIFGQEFNEEMAYDMIRKAEEIGPIHKEIYTMMSHIPAPLSVKDLYSFFTLGVLLKMPYDELIDFWRSVRRGEIRCDNNIAAVVRSVTAG
jgi:benzoyl-CoA reductase/2-hydroxyglutaryl-CoA dehydratase subunit BcrC/BadD/HgdB